MNKVSLEQYMAQKTTRNVQERKHVMDNFTRGSAALDLAEMSLEHTSSSAHAAARLLLAMEQSWTFDISLLIKFDNENRAKADLMLTGYKPHELWPSKWISEETGKDGRAVIQAVYKKWGDE